MTDDNDDIGGDEHELDQDEAPIDKNSLAYILRLHRAVCRD